MSAPGRRLGTFGGVFAPSVLTILGIILFLRLGFVVGSAGPWRALAILGVATSVSVLTSLSLAAIATNRKVRGGGDYYLISRSLGIEYGGALGLVLFLAQAVSIAFYCAGFGEGMTAAFGLPPGSEQKAAMAALGVLLAVAMLGADVATRVQYAIMASLVLSLVSFFAGGLGAWDTERFSANVAEPLPDAEFWAVFALFFPAVTGFTQGVSMSGELADPAKSLPRGTFAAVGVSTLVYAAAMLVFAGALPLATLHDDTLAMRDVATHAVLIDAGVMAATLSSALASCLGAPRILQALAADRVFRTLTPFGRLHGGIPRLATALAGAIALAVLAAGGLDAIAGIVSMFFLISYALLNYATYVEATGASPSFRPRFRFFHARASLAGTLLCGGAMLAISPWLGAIALALVAITQRYLRRTAIPVRWRDSRYAFRFRRVKEGLREIAAATPGPLDWQPHVLAFTSDEERRARLLRFAAWITGGSGLVTAVRILEGEAALDGARARREEETEALRGEIEAAGVDAYPLVVMHPDRRAAASALVQSWGMGPIHANTVLLNWMERGGEEQASSAAFWYGRLLRDALRLGQNVVVFDAEHAAWEQLEARDPAERRIDVWWLEDDSSRLALLFAYLATRSEAWDEASLRILLASTAESAARRAANLTHRIEERRIRAHIEPIVADSAAPLIEASRDASLVLVPLRIEGLRITDPFGAPPEPMLDALPIAAWVGAAGAVRLHEPEPSAETPVEPPAEEG